MPLTGDAKRAYQLNWINQRRLEWLEEHGPCVSCGSWEALEVDHRDPLEKHLNPARLWSLSLSNPVRASELLKCQVLCHECHVIKSVAWRRERAKPHGTHTRYANGCRCVPCRKAHIAYGNLWRAGRR